MGQRAVGRIMGQGPRARVSQEIFSKLCAFRIKKPVPGKIQYRLALDRTLRGFGPWKSREGAGWQKRLSTDL